MAENQANEALEKLNRGIQESKKMVQHQTMELAKDYFSDSVQALKEQIKESRATLRDLPEQIPGGQEEPFQMLFQDLMDNYTRIEEALKEAETNVAELDTETLRQQGEIEATDAARREARELGVDLTQVEGTGSEGRVTVDDVKNFAEAAGEAAEDKVEEEPKASDAAKRRAEELGLNLSEVEGTGSGGLITVKDVTSLAEEAQEGATDLAGQVTDQASGTVEQVAEGVDGAVDQTSGQIEQGAERDGSGEPKATNAARRKAEELGVDLSKINGSGAGGLITIKDVVGS